MKRPNAITGVKWPPWYDEVRKWPHDPIWPSRSDLQSRRAARWPVPGLKIVRFIHTRKPIAVDVELYVEDGRATVTGVAVRTTVVTDPNGRPEDPWKEGADFGALSLRGRELQRLKLATFARAARALVTNPGAEGAARAVRVLRQKSPRDRGTAFYADLLTWSKAASPSEIARELGERPGTVRVWLTRARKRAAAAEGQGGTS
jgi:hypothetical protein